MKSINPIKTNKMKTMMLSGMVFILLLSSCGKPDKAAQLEKLKKQQLELVAKITQLEEEINAEGLEPANEHFVPVKVKKLSLTPFNHTVNVQGTIESENNIYIPAQSQTLVTAIYVNEGDRVRKGQLLAESDGSILEKSMASLKVNVDLTNTIYEKQKRLYDQEIGSEVQYLQAKSTKESLEKQMAALQEQLKLTKIISPIDGTVDEINLKVGESAMFGGIRVLQLSALKVTANMSEAYITSVHRGDEVKVKIPTLDTLFHKKIESVSRVINAENRTFKIEIKLPSGMKDIRPNMISVLTITDYQNESAVVVPQNVIQRKGSEAFLFAAVKENGNWIARKKVVISGKSQNGQVEIISGLQANEMLITHGFQNLTDNESIAVQEN
ncbi:efflux RND transporter periplasmic adaptor subunit [Bacteroidota bacterium]